MLNSIYLGRYINSSSVIHKLNPLFKMISLFIMLISSLFIDSYYDILILFMYLLLTVAYSDINIKVYLRNIASIKLILIFVLVINLLSLNNIIISLFSTIFVILYLVILTYTTALTEITYGIELILRPFNKFIPANKIAMFITLLIRFIPIMTMEKQRVRNAYILRGVNFEEKELKNRLKNKFNVLVSSVKISIQKEKELIDSTNLRLYNYGLSRSNFRYNKWRILDTLLLILNILILIIVICY